MRAIFGAGVALLLLAACAGEQAAKGPTPEAVAKASANLTAYLDAEYQEELAESPEEMTSRASRPAMASSMIDLKRRRTSGWNGASSRSTT